MSLDGIETFTIINDPMIPESQHPVLTALNEKITSLEKQVAEANARTDYARSNASRYLQSFENLESSLKAVLLELHESEEIENDVAEKIATATGISLLKEILISGTITFSGKIEVSIFEEVESYSLHHHLSASLDLDYEGESVTDLDYDVEDAEIS
jgi:hypothetical protein